MKPRFDELCQLCNEITSLSAAEVGGGGRGFGWNTSLKAAYQLNALQWDHIGWRDSRVQLPAAIA